MEAPAGNLGSVGGTLGVAVSAGLLLRLGQPDLLNLAPVAAAGDAIFASGLGGSPGFGARR